MQQTRVTVRRPNGDIEYTIKPGTITDTTMRRKMTVATRQAGRGEIIGWAIIGEAPKGPKLNIYQRLAIEDQKAVDLERGTCPKCHTYCCGDCK